jgi:hypothetical protein
LLAALLLVVSPALSAHATPVLVTDATRLAVSCGEYFVGEGHGGGGNWSGGLTESQLFVNPNRGQSFSGSSSLCGYNYTFSLTVDFSRGLIQFESTAINTMPESQWNLQYRSVGGEIILQYSGLEQIGGRPALSLPDGSLLIRWDVSHNEEIPTRSYAAYFSVPVPEPGTAVLLALGLAAITARGARCSRARFTGTA